MKSDRLGLWIAIMTLLVGAASCLATWLVVPEFRNMVLLPTEAQPAIVPTVANVRAVSSPGFVVPTARTCTASSGTGAIKGRIVDSQDNTPIANVTVYTDPPSSSVSTDSQGNYAICDIGAYSWSTEYLVTATKDGYKLQQVKVGVIRNVISNADFSLKKTPKLSRHE